MSGRYIVIVESDERGVEYVGPMSRGSADRLADRLEAAGLEYSVEALVAPRSFAAPDPRGGGR